MVEVMGQQSLRFAKPILVLTVAIIAVSGYGISKININDNPVRWFKPSHKIRVADEVLNRELAGTYTAFLVMKQDADADAEIVAAGDAAVSDASDVVRARWTELKRAALASGEEEVTNVSDALIEATSDLSFDTVGEESERWQAVQAAFEHAQIASKTFQDPEHLAYIERLFRSPVYGVLAMVPLTITIVFTYGLIGLVGKDYDMPVAVLSSLTLGLSVDSTTPRRMVEL